MKRTLTKIVLICSFSFFYINSAFSEIAFSFDKVNIISVMNVLSTEIKKNITIEDDLDEQISLIINHPSNSISTIYPSMLCNKGQASCRFSHINNVMLDLKDTQMSFIRGFASS